MLEISQIELEAIYIQFFFLIIYQHATGNKKKDQWGKEIAELLKNVDTWAAGR